MPKFAFKVDWLNLRVEFAPNIKESIKKITKSATGGSEVDKTIFGVELISEYNTKEYPSYSVNNNSDENGGFETEEVWEDDEDTKFWKPLIDPPGEMSGISGGGGTNNESLIQENQQLKIQVDNLNQQLQAIQAQYQTLGQQYQELSQNPGSSGDVQEWQEKYNSLNLQYQTLNTQYQTIQQQNQSLQQEIQQSASQGQNIQALKQQIEQLTNQNQNLNQKVQELTDENNELKTSTSSFKLMEPTRKQAEFEKTQAQIQKLQEVVSDLDNQFSQGQIQQDIYLKKKDWLANQLGILMGKLESLR